ncbi:MAG: hypothetical protein MUC62_08140 [Candidatus Thermoplasmatota archaeon]|jgi:hypothetical protein|nr:hypothetical protein [Candidatus Thermoplasmatota archaeon]
MERIVTVQLIRCEVPFVEEMLGSLLEHMGKGAVRVIIDRDTVHGPSHLASAFMHAARAILSGRSRARDPSMEVLRWLSGSHQLVEGLKRASPGPDSHLILICTAPHNWPMEGDGSFLPLIKVVEGGPFGIKGLVPVSPGPDVQVWGGRKASKLLYRSFNGSEEQLEMALLELVAFTDLV